MQFITYWELNENMPDAERLRIAQKVQTSGLFPPANVKIIRWDSTPDLWGTIIFEADSVADVHRAVNVWRAVGAGFFKVSKTSPIMPVEELIPLAAQMQSELGPG